MDSVIAMSGGVDSSVCAYLMKKDGFSPLGVTLKLLESGNEKDIADAKAVCDSIGIPFEYIDQTENFKKYVIDEFVKSYENGATPNPCVFCNKHIKFSKIIAKADEIGASKIATGHYVELEKSNGRYLLKMAKDKSKDQSYVLYSLKQETLERTLFPLGFLTKAEIREIAEENNLVTAHKSDSQDICFVPDGKYAEVIEKYSKKHYPSGNFLDTKGNILGEHKGIIRYTIGQRRGLGLALPASMYVKEKDINKNEVILCYNDELFSKELDADDINFIPFDKLDGSIKCTAKTRYKQKEASCTVFQTGENQIHIEFEEKQRAITKGQAVVLYDGEYVIGGGTIK